MALRSAGHRQRRRFLPPVPGCSSCFGQWNDWSRNFEARRRSAGAPATGAGHGGAFQRQRLRARNRGGGDGGEARRRRRSGRGATRRRTGGGASRQIQWPRNSVGIPATWRRSKSSGVEAAAHPVPSGARPTALDGSPNRGESGHRRRTRVSPAPRSTSENDGPFLPLALCGGGDSDAGRATAIARGSSVPAPFRARGCCRLRAG